MLNTNHDVEGPLLSTTYLANEHCYFWTDFCIDYQAAIQTWQYALFSFLQQVASHNRSPDTTACLPMIIIHIIDLCPVTVLSKALDPLSSVKQTLTDSSLLLNGALLSTWGLAA